MVQQMEKITYGFDKKQHTQEFNSKLSTRFGNYAI